jgi:hypothetical protein
LIGPYDTAHAFRQALEVRLRHIAQEQGLDLQRLQRRVAFERLLARLFAQDEPPWLLKGGYALELRLTGQARSTLDLDLAVPDPSRLQSPGATVQDASCLDIAYEQVQRAAALDLQDGFVFRIARQTKDLTGAPRGGFRCIAEARLAGRTFARFHLDVGLGDVVLHAPDWVEGSTLLGFAGIPAARVALYPLAEQFAEKVHAYTATWTKRDNTRVKDLVDLVLLVHSGRLDPERVRGALRATFAARGTHLLPAELPAPPASWAEGYAALAGELDLPALTLAEAHAYLSAAWQQWGLGEMERPDP